MAVGEKSIGVTEFRPRCHALIEEVASGRIERLVLTKRGKPVAAIVPAEPRRIPSLRGIFKDIARPVPGVDLTEPTGEVWEAELD